MAYRRNTIITIFVLGYILGSFKGYLALWKDNTPEPVQIFPCPVDSLPEEDRKALEDGIVVRNQRKLEQLIEDYTS